MGNGGMSPKPPKPTGMPPFTDDGPFRWDLPVEWDLPMEWNLPVEWDLPVEWNLLVEWDLPEHQVVIQALEDLQKITLQYSPVKELHQLNQPAIRMRRKLFVGTTVERLLKRPWSNAIRQVHSPI